MHRKVLAAAVVATALLAPGTSVAQPKPLPSGAPAASTAARSAAPSASAAATAARSSAPSASATPSTSAAPPTSAAPTASAVPTTSAPPTAPSAQATLSPEEEAGKTFQLGREAFKAEDFARALDHFKKSQSLQASPGTLLNIALTEEKLGKTASAWASFQRVVEQLKVDDDRVPIAKDGVARTATRVPRLKIERAAGAPPTLAIRVDGAPLAANQVGVEQMLDPGAHVVTTLVPGFEERRYEVVLSEGQRLPLVVEPGKRTLVAVPVGPTDVQAQSGPNLGRMAAFAFAGAGLAGLGVGIATGVMTFAKKDERALACPVGTACNDVIDAEARTLAGISTGTFIFGGVALATGVVLLFTVGGGKSAFVTASATPNGGSLRARFQF